MSRKKYSGSKTNKINNEIWKQFPNKYLKNTYQVSNKGRVQNIKTGYIFKFNLKSGYYYCNISIKGKMKAFRVHRLVAELFVKNPNKYNIINQIFHSISSQ